MDLLIDLHVEHIENSQNKLRERWELGVMLAREIVGLYFYLLEI